MARRLKVDNEKGSVMNVALLVLLVLSLIGFSLSKISAIDTKIAGNEKLERIAFYAAEAGLERAMQLLEEGTLGEADWFGKKIAFGDATYEVEVLDFNGSAGTPPTVPAAPSPAPPAASGSSAGTGSSSSWSQAGGLMDEFDDLEFYDGMGGFSSTGATGAAGSTGFSSTASFGSTGGMFDDDLFVDFEDVVVDDLLIIRSTGRINNVERSIEVVFERKTYAFSFKADGALAVYGDSAEITGEVNSDVQLQGNEYKVPAVYTCFGPDCDGTPVGAGGDPIAGLSSVAKKGEDLTLTDIADGVNIVGGYFDVWDDCSNTTVTCMSAADWDQFAAELTGDGVTGDGNVDEENILEGTISGEKNLGTRDEPQVTWLKGDVVFEDRVRGAGILVVDDDVKFEDNFHFEGLILIRNKNDDGDEEFEVGDERSRIFGAVVVAGAGTASDVTIKKEARIMYSTEALENIKPLLSWVNTRVVTWREY
jgi:hypothetical protein